MSEGCGVAVGGGLCEIDEVVVYGETSVVRFLKRSSRWFSTMV